MRPLQGQHAPLRPELQIAPPYRQVYWNSSTGTCSETAMGSMALWRGLTVGPTDRSMLATCADAAMVLPFGLELRRRATRGSHPPRAACQEGAPVHVSVAHTNQRYALLQRRRDIVGDIVGVTAKTVGLAHPDALI
jgi:hypothetical protein